MLQKYLNRNIKDFTKEDGTIDTVDIGVIMDIWNTDGVHVMNADKERGFLLKEFVNTTKNKYGLSCRNLKKIGLLLIEQWSPKYVEHSLKQPIQEDDTL